MESIEQLAINPKIITIKKNNSNLKNKKKNSENLMNKINFLNKPEKETEKETSINSNTNISTTLFFSKKHKSSEPPIKIMKFSDLIVESRNEEEEDDDDNLELPLLIQVKKKEFNLKHISMNRTEAVNIDKNKAKNEDKKVEEDKKIKEIVKEEVFEKNKVIVAKKRKSSIDIIKKKFFCCF